MDTSKFIRIELIKHNKQMKDLDELYGITRQAMTRRMNRNAWQVNDLEKIAEWLDCDFRFEFRPRDKHGRK